MKGRFDNSKNKTEVNSDIKKIQNLLNIGFVLIENNTAIEHPEGGFQKLSKKSTNFFNQKTTTK
tara:strand:+ start:442 stop:633 length:192 start_codon:yes stop_codon:yes gene_type:complete